MTNGIAIARGGKRLIKTQIGLTFAKPAKIQTKNLTGIVIRNTSMIGKLARKLSKLLSTEGGRSPQKPAYFFKNSPISATVHHLHLNTLLSLALETPTMKKISIGIRIGSRDGKNRLNTSFNGNAKRYIR